MTGSAILKRIPGRWWFFIAVVILYGVVGLTDTETAQLGLSSFLSLFGHVLPVLVVVHVLILVFNAFVEPKWVARYVGDASGFKGWAVALVSGVLSLGPIYPWYALLGELKEKGMRPSLIAAFLYVRAVKPPLLPLLVHYYGLAFTTVLVGYILVFAIFNGLLTDWLAGRLKLKEGS